MPCCPLPAGRFFVGMWYMPNGVIRTFSNLGDDKTKANAIKYWNKQIKEKG